MVVVSVGDVNWARQVAALGFAVCGPATKALAPAKQNRCQRPVVKAEASCLQPSRLYAAVSVFCETSCKNRLMLFRT